jgi:hypothetical protein
VNGNCSEVGEPKARIDSLGRRINPKSLAALNAYKFKPGKSGNPGGNYKSRPFTDAIAVVSEMTVAEIAIFSLSDTGPIAAVKALFREGIKGNVQAFAELANRLEGRPAQRMQYGDVPDATIPVESKVKVGSRDLVQTLREIYGLNDPESNKGRAQSSAPNRLM